MITPAKTNGAGGGTIKATEEREVWTRDVHSRLRASLHILMNCLIKDANRSHPNGGTFDSSTFILSDVCKARLRARNGLLLWTEVMT